VPGIVHPAHAGRPAQPLVIRPASTVTSGPATGAPSLRWAIKIAAPCGPAGDGWGDVAFAADLACALERLGQVAIVDRRESHDRASGHLDDVVLVIRGLDQVPAQPGRHHILWVISHPDDVTVEEVRPYDLVYGAGAAWSESMAARSGRPVATLLQATDPARFHPGAAAGSGEAGSGEAGSGEAGSGEAGSGEAGGVLFVGSTRGVFRPVVRDALAAGIDVDLYGPGWPEFVPAEQVRADRLPAGEVPGAYARADVVLNDHWDDMARWGFVSNRVFDAVASGAAVISDDVPGIEDLFPGAVRVYRDAGHLAQLVADRDAAFGDAAARRAVGEETRKAHSFDARARTLLDDVLGSRGGGR
jgi:hypothetical protein